MANIKCRAQYTHSIAKYRTHAHKHNKTRCFWMFCAADDTQPTNARFVLFCWCLYVCVFVGLALRREYPPWQRRARAAAAGRRGNIFCVGRDARKPSAGWIFCALWNWSPIHPPILTLSIAFFSCLCKNVAAIHSV